MFPVAMKLMVSFSKYKFKYAPSKYSTENVIL